MSGIAGSTTRPPHILAKQRRKVEEFLRSGFSREDAAATGSRGYTGLTPRTTGQPRDAATTQPYKAPEPDYRPAPRTEPRWVRDIVDNIARQPRHLRELVPLGLAELTLEHRVVVWLHASQGLSFREIAAFQGHMLRIGKSTAARRWEEALDFLACFVYDDQDGIRWTREEAG